MWSVLEWVKSGNGYVKAALGAIVISVGSAWSMDRMDEDQRNRENDRMQEEVTHIKREASDMKESLARIESKLEILVKQGEYPGEG